MRRCCLWFLRWGPFFVVSSSLSAYLFLPVVPALIVQGCVLVLAMVGTVVSLWVHIRNPVSLDED